MPNFTIFQALHKRILDAGGKVLRYVFDDGTGEYTYHSYLGTTEIKITEFQDTDIKKVKHYTELVDRFLDFQKNHERDFLIASLDAEKRKQIEKDLTHFTLGGNRLTGDIHLKGAKY
jgi:hypothetical protein